MLMNKGSFSLDRYKKIINTKDFIVYSIDVKDKNMFKKIYIKDSDIKNKLIYHKGKTVYYGYTNDIGRRMRQLLNNSNHVVGKYFIKIKPKELSNIVINYEVFPSKVIALQNKRKLIQNYSNLNYSESGRKVLNNYYPPFNKNA